ncbi:MAG: hypothetical protein ACQ9CV_00130 [Nitrosopumilus sp.]|jgi:hypothetical protein
MLTTIDKSKEMKDLIEKEKKLHKEIKSDFEKISQKINEDFEMVRKSKSS